MQTNPDTYFQQVEVFHQHMAELFAAGQGIDSCVMQLLSRLDENRPYRAAPGPDPEQSYMLTTFRGHGEGGDNTANCDNEQSLRPACEHLQTLV